MTKWAQAGVLAVLMAAGTTGFADSLDDGLAALNAGDAARAYALWKPLADKGDLNAEFYIGQLYREGKGVAQDYAEAARWYQKAADQGHASAQNNLAFLYGSGLGVPKSDEIAYKWLVLAAAGGHPDAKKNIETFATRLTPEALAETEARLGWMYQTGWKVARQDSKEAAHWYLSAALRGHAVAQKNIADMFARGEGVDFNPKEAFRWYGASAAQGYYPAQYDLAMMYFKGQGVAQDFAQAYAWFYLVRLATSDANSAPIAGEIGETQKQLYLLEQQMSPADRLRANNSIGVFYHQGIGVKQDVEEARKWYQRAANDGYASAQFNLGLLYQQGAGVEKNIKLAAEWFRKAAEQGHAPAQNSVGMLLQQGAGGQQDAVAAIEWFRKAAEQGDANAQINMGAAYHGGVGVTRDYAQAMAWFRQAADAGDARALDMLGRMTLLGQGTKADALEAYKWFLLARSRGYEAAKEGLDLASAKLTDAERTSAIERAEKYREERVRAAAEPSAAVP